jgi:thiosulfate/3-mercaptopyruvate sulfurtransferase
MATTPVTERGYAHPELLAESAWLAERLGQPQLRIIDTRSQELYAQGHIPGAVSLTALGGIPREANGDMAGPERFTDLARRLGVSADSEVVVYDAPGAQMGMAAWAFTYYGHPNVRILDGGFEKWQREGRPVSTQDFTYPEGDFEAQPIEDLYCSLDHAREVHGSAGTIFWDVRSRDEYEGKAARGNPREGRIPGAVHLEWTELLDPDTKTLKPAGELRSLLQSRGITPESEIDCY